ncbi:hypothetical protein CFC21_111183, partial [Triticum aestivum]
MMMDGSAAGTSNGGSGADGDAARRNNTRMPK